MMSPTQSKKGSNSSLKTLKIHQRQVFFLTFVSYLISHFARKCYSTIKHDLHTHHSLSSLLISTMDTIFMFTYAIGNILSGNLGDLTDGKCVMTIGLIGSGICLLAFVVVLMSDVEESWKNSLMVGFYGLFGLFQSTGGPVGTSIMGNWFSSSKSHHLLFGFWTCHQYMGQIVASITTFLLYFYNLSHSYALIIPSLCSIVWAGYLYKVLNCSPLDVKELKKADFLLPSTPKHYARRQSSMMTRSTARRLSMEKEKNEEDVKREEKENKESSISFLDCLKLPQVIRYSFIFGCLKLTNYVLFFWLPFYTQQLSQSKIFSQLTASCYSIGMMPGGIVIGYFIDMFPNKKSTIIGLFMVLLVFVLSILQLLTTFPTYILVILFTFMGLLIGGPNNIITSAVAVELSSQLKDKKSIGTVTGFINGCGSFIASIGLLGIGNLQERYGWNSVWGLLIGSIGLGLGLLINTICREWRSVGNDDKNKEK